MENFVDGGCTVLKVFPLDNLGCRHCRGRDLTSVLTHTDVFRLASRCVLHRFDSAHRQHRAGEEVVIVLIYQERRGHAR